jgi:hypothetical protein
MQPAAAVGVAQAVFQQVIEQLHQPVFVAKHHRAVRQGEVDFQVAAGKAFAEGAAATSSTLITSTGAFW